MHLVPISLIGKPKVTITDMEYQAFIEVLSWMHVNNAISSTGRMYKARLKKILNCTGNGNVDLTCFIEKMLMTKLFVAETPKTVVFAKQVVENKALDDLMAYLMVYLRNF
jgi:hypothetical protein